MKKNLYIRRSIFYLSNWRNIFFLAFILLLIIGVIIPEATVYMKGCLNGNKRLDMSFFYTPDDVYQCLEAYGAKGRNTYIFILLTLDFVFPVFYTLFLCAVISVLLKQLYLSKYTWPIYLPIIIFICDIVENMSIAFLIFQFPIKYSLFVRLTAIFNVFKWLVFGICILMVFATGTIVLIRHLKEVADKIELNRQKSKVQPKD